MTTCVAVFTFNRSAMCLDLLAQIDGQRPDDARVLVFDDCSTEHYDAVRGWCDARPWARYERAAENHGKRQFWAWVSAAYQRLRETGADAFVLLPDDVALCRDFFRRAREAWASIPGFDAVAMALMVDALRESTPCWTAISPEQVSDDADLTGWVEGEGPMFCIPQYFDILEWSVPPVHPSWWWRDPDRGSGVGAQVSRAIVAAGGGLYRVRQSLVVHRVPVGGTMDPALRPGPGLKTIRFIDGPEEQVRLERP